eukprot:scaffold84966_cov68-Phaeocystis_antarctica.AAC.2
MGSNKYAGARRSHCAQSKCPKVRRPREAGPTPQPDARRSPRAAPRLAKITSPFQTSRPSSHVG